MVDLYCDLIEFGFEFKMYVLNRDAALDNRRDSFTIFFVCFVVVCMILCVVVCCVVVLVIIFCW